MLSVEKKKRRHTLRWTRSRHKCTCLTDTQFSWFCILECSSQRVTGICSLCEGCGVLQVLVMTKGCLHSQGGRLLKVPLPVLTCVHESSNLAWKYLVHTQIRHRHRNRLEVGHHFHLTNCYTFDFNCIYSRHTVLLYTYLDIHAYK